MRTHTSPYLKDIGFVKNKGSIFLSYLLVIVGGRILAGGKMAALNLVQFGVLLSFRIIAGMYFTLKHFLQALTASFQGLRVKECGNFSISNPCETVISLK